MGKGKGMLERSVIRSKKNFSIFEFKGFSNYRLNKFYLNINKKLNLGLYIYFKNNKIINYNLWCKNTKYITFFDKYLIY